MARFTLGVGYGRVAQDDERPHLALSGGGLTTAIAFGFAIVDNFSLHAEIFGLGGSDASMELDGVDVDEGESTFNVSGLGAGMTFYIMPINIYIAATVGIGGVTVDTSRTTAMVSDSGFILHALVGKEFWLTANWALGGAIQGMFVTAPDELADGVSWSGFGIGVLISATYQ